MPSLLSRAATLLVPPFCWACGGDASGGEPLCCGCRAELRWLEAGDGPVWAPLAYDGPARALVRGLKYRGAPGLAEPMAAMIVANAPPGLLAPGAALVPVPLARARRRTRGFNQAERLARAVATRRGLTVADCLVRRGSARQVGRSREQRLVAMQGTIVARGLAPPRCVVIDDVATTGATHAACRDALLAAGAREVRAIAFARTPGR